MNRQAVRRLTAAKHDLLIDGFDELNVIKRLDRLYADLDSDARRKLRELYVVVYEETYLSMTGRKRLTGEQEDELDELAEMYLSGLLSEPNAVTRYAWDAEVYRKRDRAKEAVNAVPTRVQKQIEMDKALRYWSQMAGWYADLTAEDASVMAMKDAGVKKVKRHEQDDRKVCTECREADGEIYPIDDIPPKPHLHCRRWFTKAG